MFIDSSAYIALYNRRDRNHGRAREFVGRVRERELGPVTFYTSDYVFDEVVTSIVALTGRKDLAVAAGEAILTSRITRLIKVDHDVFREAWALFKRHADKLWSFTDCTSFVMMRGTG